jgi:hypothetical protein
MSNRAGTTEEPPDDAGQPLHEPAPDRGEEPFEPEWLLESTSGDGFGGTPAEDLVTPFLRETSAWEAEIDGARADRPTAGFAPTILAETGGSPAVPEIPLGTLVLREGDRRLSYQFAPQDLVWTAKLLVHEAGGQDDPDNAAVLWAMFNRYALFTHRVFPTFAQFVRAYSTTLQPVLRSPRAAARHMHRPATEFVRTGGTYPGTTIPRGQLRRHLDIQRATWPSIKASARDLAMRGLTGQLPNPGIGLASEFASTRIYFRQRHGRNPSPEEWRQYTTDLATRKRWRWVGEVPGLNQMRNAFFVDLRATRLPNVAVSVLPPGTSGETDESFDHANETRSTTLELAGEMDRGEWELDEREHDVEADKSELATPFASLTQAEVSEEREFTDEPAQPAARGEFDAREGWDGEAPPDPGPASLAQVPPLMDEAEGLFDAALAKYRDVVDAMKRVMAGVRQTPTCCSDADVARALGIALDTSRNGLFGFDGEFSGVDGTQFADQVRDVAQLVQLDPGLLATNLLAEIQSRNVWLSPAPIRSPRVGVDYWHEERPRIRQAVPAAAGIMDQIVRDPSGRPVHFINEVGRDTGPIYEFATGRDGMLALASAVAYRDVRLRHSLPPGAYDQLSPAVRFAAIRLAFNAGTSRGRRMVAQAAAGRDPLIRTGPTGPQHPTRTASLRAGQAIHLSCTIFGNSLPCP